MRARHTALAGLTALLLSACGGGLATTASSPTSTSPAGNGESAKTGEQVANDAAAALQKAGAVHIAGSLTSDGAQNGVDLRIQDADIAGTVTQGGQTAEMLATGGKMYLRASAAFWTAQGVPRQALPRLGGKWVLVPADGTSDMTPITLDGLVQQLRQIGGAANRKVTTGTLGGQRVVVVSQSDGSTLEVAAEGEPYPLRITDKGSEPGTLTVDGFGQRTPMTPPADAFDVSRLGG